MFQLWCDNVDVGTRWSYDEAEHDARYMSYMWGRNVAIWACDDDGDYFVKMITAQPLAG